MVFNILIFKIVKVGIIKKILISRENDLLKNKYCFEHNIPLIRIPYNKEYTF